MEQKQKNEMIALEQLLSKAWMFGQIGLNCEGKSFKIVDVKLEGIELKLEIEEIGELEDLMKVKKIIKKDNIITVELFTATQDEETGEIHISSNAIGEILGEFESIATAKVAYSDATIWW